MSDSSKFFKVIHDTVHGAMKLDGPALKLVGTPELMRLASIKQLGTAYLVFPGANHTRFEHCIGTSFVAGQMAEQLGLEVQEALIVRLAALLHDIGHPPFSHVLEGVLHRKTGMDHMDITKRLITGEQSIGEDIPGVGSIPGILEDAGVSPKEVAPLINEDSSPESNLKMWYNPGIRTYEGDRRYLKQIINGVVDADQMDYLLRDSHYTGVALGVIDLPRLLNTLEIFDNQLVLNLKGLTAVEGMLVARSLMYTSVYFHKTNRITDNMLVRAVEKSEADEDIWHMVDGQFLEHLYAMGGFQREVVQRLRYRLLYKTVYLRSHRDMDDCEREYFAEMAKPAVRREMEDFIARKSGLKPGEVIIDIPIPELLLSEPRIDQTEIRVTDGKGIKQLSAYSPISSAVQKRTVPMWSVVVCSIPEARERVKAVVESEFHPSSM